jgi:hypothetical protein
VLRHFTSSLDKALHVDDVVGPRSLHRLNIVAAVDAYLAESTGAPPTRPGTSRRTRREKDRLDG